METGREKGGEREEGRNGERSKERRKRKGEREREGGKEERTHACTWKLKLEDNSTIISRDPAMLVC